MLFWLILLGIFAYLLVQRSVANITRTPVWLLWLVMMAPALIWTAWIVLDGQNTLLSMMLLGGAFVLSPVLYYVLVRWGRIPQEDSSGELPKPEEEQPMSFSSERRPVLRPIDKEEEASLQDCFPWSVFYLQNIEYRPQALICRGRLRSSPQVAYETIRDNVQAKFGDRFLVVFQEGLNGKPFFALVPNSQAQTAKQPVARPAIAIALLLATLVTSTLAGVLLSGYSAEQFQSDPSLIVTGLPYALALMAILGTHELAHYLMARRYQIRASLPYFIPVPPAAFFPFGTFGAFIQMRSHVPNRKALFDIGLAGPLAGFVVALPLLFWGLAHSKPVELVQDSGILSFDSFRPAASLLIALVGKLSLGDTLLADQALDLHPVAIAACLGIVVTALNLMPVGQLDGGHIVHAMLGQRKGAIVGQMARLLVLALSFVQQELLLWAILLFFIPIVDEPALNDVSELDNGRDLLGLLALCLLVLIILPAPPVLTRLLF
jgi:membrane-associated protease RseP (regulator of RpoE activity)